jgi:serine/threonine protein phosphatase PrpC
MIQDADVTLAFAAATDIGCARANNEDSFGYDTSTHLYVVCDGVGGSAAGEIASNTAARVLIESFAGLLTSPDEPPTLPLENRLLYCFQEANRAVREIAMSNGQGMGSTLVCACLEGTRMLIGNVGDSRAYLIREGACVQITQDHSLVSEQLRNGMITAEMAAASNLQSVITRAIGAMDTVEPDLFAVELRLDDIFLLATDGLTRYLPPENIASIASLGVNLPAICEQMIGVCREKGGADNITCMALRAVEAPINL